MEDIQLTEKGKPILPRPAGRSSITSPVIERKLYLDSDGSICKYCKEKIVWKVTKRGNYYGWTPYNKDNSRHSYTCKVLNKVKK